MKGVVYLLYNVIGTNDVNEGERRLIWRGAHVVQTIPMKVRAFHICFNDRPLRNLASLFLSAAGKEFRARCRLHSGEPHILNIELECVLRSIAHNLISRTFLVIRYEHGMPVESHDIWNSGL